MQRPEAGITISSTNYPIQNITTSFTEKLVISESEFPVFHIRETRTRQFLVSVQTCSDYTFLCRSKHLGGLDSHWSVLQNNHIA
jgi:hypothetical protein